MPAQIGLVSLELDLHVHAVAARLKERFDIKAHVFATDDFAEAGVLSFDLRERPFLTSYASERVCLSDLGVVWWRRVNQPQKPTGFDQRTEQFISSEWKFSLQSLWMSEFSGIWVNDPTADIRATGKTVQLRAAMDVGLKVPRTTISNDPASVKAFYEAESGNIIVKKIAGVSGMSLATVPVQSDLLDSEAIRVCPAIYQQRINVDLHLRVIVLGKSIIALSFRAGTLDWRRDLSFKPRITKLDEQCSLRIQKLMEALGLRMAVIDMAIDMHDDLYFLEVNPQGQFLFLEQLAGEDLTTPCAEYFASLI